MDESQADLSADLARSGKATSVRALDEAVQAERRRLLDLLNLVPGYVVLLSSDYHVRFANRYFEERFGKSEGRLCYEHLFHRSQPCENCETYKVLKTNAPHHWEWLGPDGRHYDIHDFPFTDSDGSSLILEMGIDITERKAAEGKLRRLNRSLRALRECGQLLLHAENEQELLDGVCRILVEECGYSLAWVGYPQQDEGKTVRPVAVAGVTTDYVTSGLVTWEDAERGRGPTGTAIRTGKVMVIDDAVADPRFAPWRERALSRGFYSCTCLPVNIGEKLPAGLAVCAPIKGAFHGDELQLLTELAQDLGYGIRTLRMRVERNRAYEELRRSQQRLSLHVQQTPLAVIEWNLNYEIADWNARAEALFGYTREEALGRRCNLIVPENAQSHVEEVWKQLLARKGGLRSTNGNITKDGRLITCEWYNTPLVDDGGNVIGVASLAEDISDRARAEEELKHYAEELERSNAELQDFASIASHDLQEPLRKVIAFGEHLKEHCGDQLDELGLDFLARMQNAAQRMSLLIEALLEYSRVTTRARPFQSVDLTQIVFQVLADMEQRIAETRARVEFAPLPKVMADATQLRQLVQNLVGNALKFQPPGAAPHVQIDAGPTVNGWCELRVRDNGIGFDENYLERIFRPFQRLHGRGEYPGSGMGLAICRKVAMRHGGSITAHSRRGQGSTFVVTLPAATNGITELQNCG